MMDAAPPNFICACHKPGGSSTGSSKASSRKSSAGNRKSSNSSGSDGSKNASPVFSEYGSRPNLEQLEARRLSCSRTEFRPIHTDIIKSNLKKVFQHHGSLPSKRSAVTELTMAEQQVEDEEYDVWRNFMARLEVRRNSFPAKMQSHSHRSQDSGIGSSPDEIKPNDTFKEAKVDLMFALEM